MENKIFRKIRIGITIFTTIIIAVAVTLDNIILAMVGVLSGMAFMVIARSRMDVQIDEREKIVREKAAQMAYTIFAPTIGIGSE